MRFQLGLAAELYTLRAGRFPASVRTAVDAFAFIFSQCRKEGQYTLPDWRGEIEPLAIQNLDCTKSFMHPLHDAESYDPILVTA